MKHRKMRIAACAAALLLSAGRLTVFAETLQGDLNSDGAVNRSDCSLLFDYLLTSRSDISSQQADLDSDRVLTAKDLTLLKKQVLNPKQQGGGETHSSGSAYMQKVRESYLTDVPQNMQRGGDLQHITYFSQKANKEKGAHVWLPPEYDPAKQYPVMYINHGIFGNEFSMVGDFNIVESATALIQSGEAVPMILVFTSMYTNPNKDNCDGITAEEEPFYDAFLEDLTDCLMPYVTEHYLVKTGRENTAVAGFSMGGRESLYIGVSRPDLFGYIAATSPAPGVFPATDQFFTHPGSMPAEQFKISAPYEPYLLMIAGGTADGMVNVAPENYSKMLTQNGTDHIFISVPGGGHDGTTGIPLFYNFIRAAFQA